VAWSCPGRGDHHDSLRERGQGGPVLRVHPGDSGPLVVGDEAGGGQQARQLDVVVADEHFDRNEPQVDDRFDGRRQTVVSGMVETPATTMGSQPHVRFQSVSTTPATGPASSIQNT